MRTHSPEALTDQLVFGSHLADSKVREALWRGGLAAVEQLQTASRGNLRLMQAVLNAGGIAVMSNGALVALLLRYLPANARAS